MESLKFAFPVLEDGFWEVLSDRIIENGFNNERLIASVNHVIDNCIYPSPTLAQFISFDKMMKVYSYDQVLKMNDLIEGAFDRYKGIRLHGRSTIIFAEIGDVEKYSLELWSK